MRACPHCGQPIPAGAPVLEGQVASIVVAPIAPAAAGNPGVVWAPVSFAAAAANPSPPRMLPDYSTHAAQNNYPRKEG